MEVRHRVEDATLGHALSHAGPRGLHAVSHVDWVSKQESMMQIRQRGENAIHSHVQLPVH